MAKFMFLQRGGGSCENRPEMTPEEMQQTMQIQVRELPDMGKKNE